MNIKKLEKFAIVLLVLWALQGPIGYIAMAIFANTSSIKQLSSLTLWHLFSGYALMSFKQLVNILIGVWLFITIKKEKQDTPWFWLMLGILTGILAALLYFILRIYQSVKQEHELSSEAS